ncbi:major royal jelly family protein [Micromonospora sp. DR5-3]|uniref:L-dopachrome tautomerase-related protein n=1 Tax=unclassified Micromonospora TaxID=2617518 RepID=UPI0011D68AAC|nr:MULTISPECIES: L-dopachrome tautomerase-related protein [unclassified Micromonospora]MCW3816397.1 major royal jelly family protein [Micromonospora sp. DR5-3]TYC22732.1 gluconolaconase [Micromonospora sp. MP36]
MTLPGDEPLGELELVHSFTGPMPTGISVSHTGRIFVNFPKWGDEVPATLVELRDGQEVPFPDQAWNNPSGNDDANAFVSVQSIVVDPADRLWVLDTGSPMFQPTSPGGPKLVRIDLDTDTVAQVITFPTDVALPSTYLNDVRFDLRRGDAGVAYITDSSDSGPNGIIVVDLASGASWRRLHDHPTTKAEPLHTFRPIVEGRPFVERPADGAPKPVAMGSDGIAISADGSRLHYCPLASRRWYSVATDALTDRSRTDADVAATVVDEGDKGGGADGLETDDAGRLYLTSYEHNAVLRRRPDGEFETVAHDPRLLWPDTMSVATDRHLYVTANQLHRQAKYQRGQDLRRKPYALFRIPIDAGPVLLR